MVVRLKPNAIGSLKLFSPFFARIGQKVWHGRLARLKAAVESSPRDPASHTD